MSLWLPKTPCSGTENTDFFARHVQSHHCQNYGLWWLIIQTLDHCNGRPLWSYFPLHIAVLGEHFVTSSKGGEGEQRRWKFKQATVGLFMFTANEPFCICCSTCGVSITTDTFKLKKRCCLTLPMFCQLLTPHPMRSSDSILCWSTKLSGSSSDDY